MRILNLIERIRCFDPIKRNDVVREEEDVGEYSKKNSLSLSYKKLPQLPLLKLSVLKLDGSVFEFYVRRTATIAELKQAVEEVFGSSNLQGMIPWSLVWGHFCLCHVGQKLTNDKACIQNFGIKDGDQLHFIRHMSISNSPFKRRSKSESVPYKQFSMLTNGHEEEEENDLEGYDNNGVEEDNSMYSAHEDLEVGPVPKFKMVHFFRGWLYAQATGVFRKGI